MNGPTRSDLERASRISRTIADYDSPDTDTDVYRTLQGGAMEAIADTGLATVEHYDTMFNLYRVRDAFTSQVIADKLDADSLITFATGFLHGADLVDHLYQEND